MCEGKKPTTRKKGPGMAGYMKKLMPSGAIVDFVFKEDFDGDGTDEAVIGYTEFMPFPPESSVVYLKHNGNEYKHTMLLSSIKPEEKYNCGIFDNAVSADTDNDGRPELVLSLAAGNGHYITVLVFDWHDGEPLEAWRSNEPCYHGNIEVLDADDDGIYEIITNSGTFEGNEILALDEASYHMRKSYCYKWDGKGFKKSPFQVRMPYLSFNTAVTFLKNLWVQEYKKSYETVLMPGFIGLSGLDDCSFNAFKKYVNKNIRPVLQRNLSKGKLIPSEPYDNFCLFSGENDDISVEMVQKGGRILVQSINIHKKTK